ncbi:hypothetical protein ACLI4U_00190 [Natrialbaceae archaeon A-CW2]|uniref:hypothetical protein n=1 Tax=Natronosalvus amylolyticus TaxID=2961994 RepID=UPI0020C9C39C|nr:hypothetical protein [Natronosalvus amylolyticus]
MIAGQPEGKEDLYEDLIERNSNEPIYTESDDEGWVIVRVEESYPGDVGSENLANTLVQSLQLPGIERVGTKGDEIVVYEPVNQWAGQYRFTDAEGSIATDSDSDVVREASVTYTQTEATTYFEYVTGDREKRAYEYEYTPDADVNLETPTWVEACIYDDDCEAVR